MLPARKRVEKARAAIAKEAKELAGIDFVCEPDARRAAELFMDRHAQRFHELSFEVAEETIREKRARRGRPRKDEQPPAEKRVYKAAITIDSASGVRRTRRGGALRLDGFEAWVRCTATPLACRLCRRYLHRCFTNTVGGPVPKCADGNIYMRKVSSRMP